MRDGYKSAGSDKRVDFPSFSEGLSLRASSLLSVYSQLASFPFLFGGTFIEGYSVHIYTPYPQGFPFLFGGTFIEGPGV